MFSSTMFTIWIIGMIASTAIFSFLLLKYYKLD